MCNRASNKSILIGRTGKKGRITVCDHCQLYLTPHFNYSWGRHQEKALFFNEACLVDDMGNLPLDRRQDIQAFLTAQNWQYMIETWNAHNPEQISPDTHVPFYINLLQNQDIARVGNNSDEVKLGGRIYIVVDDEDARPHFHFRQRNTGKDWAISLTEAKYLKPTPGELTKKDIETMVAVLRFPCRVSSGNKYNALLRIWNDQNCEESTRYQRVDEDYPMPDYNTLLTCDKQRVDGKKTGHLGPSCA